jgi:hypothetical protein
VAFKTPINPVVAIFFILSVAAGVGFLSFRLLVTDTGQRYWVVVQNDVSSTVGWQTYRDETLGIEFEYPTAWGKLVSHESSAEDTDVVSGSIFGIVCEDQSRCGGFFGITSETLDYHFLGLIEGGIESYKGTKEEREKLDCVNAQIEVGCKMFTLQGRKGILKYAHWEAAGGSHDLQRVVFIENPNNKYRGINFSIWLPSFDETSDNSTAAGNAYRDQVTRLIENGSIPAPDRELIELFDKIIASVKFIDVSDDFSSWQTYRNEEYGFEVKYPNEWKDVNGEGVHGEILDIVYGEDQKIHAHGIGYYYPGQISIRGIEKVVLLPYGSPMPATFEDFIKRYNEAGLENKGIVHAPMSIDGRTAVKISAPNNLTGPIS